MKLEIASLLISFALAVITGLIVIPILKKFKVGQIERNYGPESHLKKQGTPTMGGIILILVMIISVTGLYIYMRMNNQVQIANKILPILLLTVGFGIIGFIDDFKKLVLKNTDGLKPWHKILGLLIISVAYIIYLTKVLNLGTETYIPIIKQYINLPMFIYIPFAILVLLGATNAINLTDGIDGLSSSVSAIIITCLTIIAVKMGIPEISLFGGIIVGTTLGFLIFNLHPAKVFMGDTGSLLLGGVVSAMALYLKMPLLLLVIALVPVIETLSVMIQVLYFNKTGKRLFKMTPIHHHFELSGWNENKIVSVFSLFTLLLCIIGLKII